MNGFDASWLWAFGLLGLAAGFAGGVLVGFRYLSSKSRVEDLEQQLAANKAQQEEYKQQVTAHFAKTAHLFQDMTDSYRNVYQHLAEGANELCSDLVTTPQLDLPDAKALTGIHQEAPESEDILPEEPVPESEGQSATSPIANEPADEEADTGPARAESKSAVASETVSPVPPAASAVSEEEDKDQTVLH